MYEGSGSRGLSLFITLSFWVGLISNRIAVCQTCMSASCPWVSLNHLLHLIAKMERLSFCCRWQLLSMVLNFSVSFFIVFLSRCFHQMSRTSSSSLKGC